MTARKCVMNQGEYPSRAIRVAGKVAANIATPSKPSIRPSIGLPAFEATIDEWLDTWSNNSRWRKLHLRLAS